MNQPFSLEHKIQNEKRRRTQIYSTIDYLISNLTYFDFFSVNAFSLVKYSKYLASSSPNLLVTNELIFLSFFSFSNTKFCEFLRQSGITENRVQPLLQYIIPFSDNFFSIQGLPLLFSKKTNKKVKFSKEVYNLFEKAAENALKRFKTPVITNEILFITLLEEKSFKISKILKKILKTDTKWYLFRFELVKMIHSHQSAIRSEVSINQQYFGYLLQIQLNSDQFNQLIEQNNLSNGVSLFRNSLISNILKLDFFNYLTKDIETSIYLTSACRSYTA